MCCGPSLNLCRCGCSELDHEEVYDWVSIALTDPGIAASIPLPMKRGKCHGTKLSPVVFKDGKPDHISVDPCDCTEFHPIFEPMCRMP